ncbi:hypothetical protein B0H17DRAFT_1177955 [Mycena rosella]|uniref:Uncharacterized protein n=1 Tax=Mycena rosella TaxID=1033263 RepID=A0AAD7DPF7_MYCRO|nr:hypothetical protein B0H17DRAFT_1177955 [Mycena rosella]
MQAASSHIGFPLGNYHRMTSNDRVLIVGTRLGGVPYLVLDRDASAQGWSIGVSWIIKLLLGGIITADKPDLRSTCANYAEECLALQCSKAPPGEKDAKRRDKATRLNGCSAKPPKAPKDRFNEALETIKKNSIVEPFKTVVEEMLFGDAAHAMSIYLSWCDGQSRHVGCIQIRPIARFSCVQGGSVRDTQNVRGRDAAQETP